MKPGSLTTGRLTLAFLAVAATLALVSWDFKQTPTRSPQKTYIADTVPDANVKDRERKVRDLDDAISELDRLDMNKEVEKAMQEVKEALKNVDMAKMQADAANALKNVDMDNIKKEVEKAMKDVDMEKIKSEIDASMARIDWDQMKENLAKIKDIKMDKLDVDMKKVQEELDKMGPQIRESLEKAKIEVEKAKVELKEYKSFVDGLEKDGLVDKKDGYSLHYKNGKLTINGKDAPAQVYEKYRSFLDKHPSFNFSTNEDSFNGHLD